MPCVEDSRKSEKYFSIYIFIYILYTIGDTGIAKADDKMIGPGHYIVERIYTCENENKYPLKFNVYKHKLNRTHDVYDSNMNLTVVLDDKVGMYAEVFKLVDGGYKPYYTMQYKCACCFIKEYAEANFARLLTIAGVDPPDCPVPKGYYNMTDFTFDNEELPGNGVIGEYNVKCTMKSDRQEDLACLMMNINFVEDD